MVTARRKPPEKEQSRIGNVIAPARPTKHVMSVRLPIKLHADLKAMSEATYHSITSLLVGFARDRVKDWKDEVARAAAPSGGLLRRRRRREEEDEDQER